MKIDLTDAHKLLASRIGDSLDRAERGELVCGNFLTPGEVAVSREILRERKNEERAFFFGGYSDAVIGEIVGAVILIASIIFGIAVDKTKKVEEKKEDVVVEEKKEEQPVEEEKKEEVVGDNE